MTTTIDNKNAPVTAGAEGGQGKSFPWTDNQIIPPN